MRSTIAKLIHRLADHIHPGSKPVVSEAVTTLASEFCKNRTVLLDHEAETIIVILKLATTFEIRI